MVRKQTPISDMSKAKCSIIVPVYKAEEFIARSIDSILQQTFPDWELLLIDDGSPDNSGIICDEYAAKDERIRVVHQKNSGVSTARNKGLDLINGDYVLFLDSDDWLDVNCIEYCINEMSKTKADILQFPTERTSKPNYDTAICTIAQGRIYTAEEYIAANNFFVCIGGTVICANIIMTNNIRFRNDIKLAEDQMFIMDCLRRSDTVYRSDYPFYKYYINDGSATSSSKSANIKDSIKALTKYKSSHPEFTKTIDYTLLYFIWYIIKNMDVPNRELSRLIKNARIAYNSKFSKVEKGFIYLGRISPFLSIYYVRLYKYLKA